VSTGRAPRPVRRSCNEQGRCVVGPRSILRTRETTRILHDWLEQPRRRDRRRGGHARGQYFSCRIRRRQFYRGRFWIGPVVAHVRRWRCVQARTVGNHRASDLSRAKRKVGTALNSAAMHADARQTEFCTYLSGILLGGLLLNTFWGWWWADPLAALVMMPIIAKEGLDGLQGKACQCD